MGPCVRSHAVVFYLRRVSTKNTLRVWDDEAPLQNCLSLTMRFETCLASC